MFTGKSFVYTGKNKYFVWDEAGISLHFPAASCDKQIKISVTVVDIEEAIVPMRYQLMPKASAMYRITASDTLPAPIKVRMQHCAVLEKEDSLVYIIAHEGPPYRFQLLPGGKFPLQSSYGEMELTKFSYFQIMWHILSYRMFLSLQIFYFADYRARVIVTKDINENKTTLRQKFKDCIGVTRYSIVCDYATKKISFKLPDSTVHGWCITTSCNPLDINIERIYRYRPGRIPPSIELHMEWNGEGKPQEKEIEIGIDGVDIETFVLLCRPMKPAAQRPSRSDKPTMSQLENLHAESGDNIRIIEKIRAKYHPLALLLMNDERGVITSAIINTQTRQPNKITRTILSRWLQGKGRHPLSWSTLIAVLHKIELSELAQKIDRNLAS